MIRTLMFLILFFSMPLLAVEFDSQQSLKIDQLDYFEDQSRQLGVDDVSLAAASFTHNTPYGFSDSVFWMRIELNAEQLITAGWVLDLGFYPINRAQFFYRANVTGAWQVQSASDQLPLSEREVRHSNIVFRLPEIPAGEHVLYLRIEPRGSMQANLALYSPQQWAEKLAMQNYSFGLYFGLMLAMVLYNLFLFVGVRDKNYIYYALFIASFGFFVLTMNGLAFEFLWPESVAWSLYSLLFFGGISICFSTLFYRSFLQTKQRAPKLDIGMQLFFWLGLASMAWSLFLPVHIAAPLQSSIAVCEVLLASIIGVQCFIQGYKPAKYLIFASAALCFGIFVFELQHAGVIEASVFTQMALPLGSVFQVLLLSFALVSRMNIEKQEKLEAQQQAIEQLNKNDSILEASLAHEQKMSELKDSFLVQTSHELRTPLHGMIGLAEALAVKEIDQAKHRDLSIMVASGQRLSHMIDDVLDFSQLSYESLSLETRAVDLHHLVEVVVAVQEPLANEKSLVLSSLVPDDLPAVEADEDRLQQVLYNLIGNAIKYTSHGSVEVSAQVIEGDLLVRVNDTGMGIKASHLKLIFEPYRQAEQVLKSQTGIGLGLAVTKQLVKLHGGEISVESTVGQGSCFSFTLPVSKKSLALASESKEVAGKGGASRNRHSDLEAEAEFQFSSTAAETVGRILLVDDDPVNLRVVINQLTPNGFDVVTAINGIDALDVLEDEGPFDLVLLDIMMPQMNGIETCEAIRLQYSSAELPIIFLTAKQQNTDLVLGLRAGGNDYLNKPFSMQELIARVSTHLQLKQSYTELQTSPELGLALEERAKSDKTLLDGQQMFSEIMHVIDDGMVAFDRDGNLSFINHYGLAFFGFTESWELATLDVMHKPFSEMFSSLDFEALEQAEKPWKSFGDCTMNISTQVKLSAKYNKASNEAVYADVIHWSFPADSGWVLLLNSKPLERMVPAVIDLIAGQGEEKTPAPVLSRQETMKRIQLLNQLEDTRLLLVNLLTESVDFWTLSSGLSKLELAEQSNIWKVILEKRGVFRARTLERHMSLKSLPKKPRWQEILSTADFVLQYASSERSATEQYQKLEQRWLALKDTYSV